LDDAHHHSDLSPIIPPLGETIQATTSGGGNLTQMQKQELNETPAFL